MELAICLAVLIGVMELREWRFSMKMKEMAQQLKLIRTSQVAFDKGVAQVFDRIETLEKKQPDLAVIEQIISTLEEIKLQQAKILVESEIIAKYKAQNEHYDMIEGAV